MVLTVRSSSPESETRPEGLAMVTRPVTSEPRGKMSRPSLVVRSAARVPDHCEPSVVVSLLKVSLKRTASVVAAGIRSVCVELVEVLCPACVFVTLPVDCPCDCPTAAPALIKKMNANFIMRFNLMISLLYRFRCEPLPQTEQSLFSRLPYQ